jgi:hypothetical protein
MSLDPTTAQRQIAELKRRQQLRDTAKNQFSQQTSDQIGSSYTYQPWAAPGIHLSNAQVGADQSFQQQLLDLTSKRAIQESDIEKPKKSGWFEKYFYSKAKTGSRWLFAGMQTLPDLVQNAASDIFDSGSEQGGSGPFSSISGWWQSTSLGSMMSDSTKSGSGFFANKEFNELQAERARRYRGEINGHAFTIGRKAAYSVGLEDGLLYNMLSGAIDATVNIGADPTTAVGKTIKAAKYARNAIEVSGETGSLAARVAAGLAGDADELAWNQNATVNWLRGNTKFKNLRDQLASTKSIAGVMDAYGDRIPLEIAVLIADESDPKKIEALLVAAATKLGLSDSSFGVTQEVLEANDKLLGAFRKLSAGMGPTNLSDIPGAKGNLRMLVQRKPLGQGGNRWLTQMPTNQVIIHGTSEQRVQAFRNISNAVNSFGKNISPERKQEIIEKFARSYADGSTRDFFEAQQSFHGVIKELLKANGISDDVIDAAIRGEQNIKAKLRAYFVDETGKHTDGGLARAMLHSGLVDDDDIARMMGGRPTNLDDIRFVGPTASIDFIDRVQILPNFKRINRLAKNPFLRRAMDSKVTRKAVDAADFMQNEIWKTTTLMTMGYVMRNLIDGQMRYALKFSGQGGAIKRLMGKEESQAVGFFRAPLDYISWAMHKKAKGTIMGEDFAAGGLNADEAVEGWVKQQQRAVGAAMLDQTSATDNFIRTGEFVPVEYGPENIDAFAQGVAQQMNRYRRDVISRMLMEGQTYDEVVDYLMSESGAGQANELLDNLQRGVGVTDARNVVMTDPDSGRQLTMRINIKNDADRRQALRIIVEHRYDNAIKHLREDGNEKLRLAFLTGRVGLEDHIVENVEYLRNNMRLVPQASGDDTYRIGSMFEMDSADGAQFWAIDSITTNPSTGELMYRVRRLSNDEAFMGAREEGSELLRQTIKQNAADQLLPKYTIYENYDKVRENADSKLESVVDGWRSVSRWFFNNVSGKAMAKLEKDPIFRQLYYKNVYENVDLLAPAEAKKILGYIDSRAAEAGTTAEKYATKGVIKRLKAQADSTSEATGTAKQLNQYAGRIAGYEMSDILFDAASKSNIEDALRIAAPFGAAWREVFQKWAKLIAEDPAVVLRAQRVYNGLSEAEVAGGDGGFFYKDPVTGENMFTFPFSGELSKFASGGAIEAPLAAPVKRLTMGFNVMPSIGPMAQMAASSFLPDKPMFDDVRDVLLPYGEIKTSVSETLLPKPGWLRKLEGVFTQNTVKSDTVYATTYIDTLRALSTTGKYDLSTEEGKNQLMDDAKDKARWLTIFRAASQFLGPTVGAPQYKIKLQGGDIYAGELVKEFQRLQAENYDTAVGQFLNMFGPEAELYIASKTKAKYGGLEATDEFSNFERGNDEFFNRHKEVAGYFAPEGSEFSFAAWDRQLRSGKRERLSDVEVIRTAQNAIGSFKYRQLRLMYGSYPSEEQRLWLRQQRSLLARQYPGFPEKAVFEVGKLEQFVQRLGEASQYPGVDKLPITNAIKRYLDYRQQAIDSALASGVDMSRSVSAQPLRDWLIAQANQLISEVPSFGRVFDRELAAEIED